MDDGFFCIADCGCAGGQIAAFCLFDPNCPRCAQHLNTFTEEEAAGLLTSLGFTVVKKEVGNGTSS